MRFLGHNYPIFGFLPDSGVAYIHKKLDAMLLRVSALLYCTDIIDLFHIPVCLFITSLHVFTGF
jgi:hypothetical protein